MPDPKALTKAVTFGEVDKISTKPIPKGGPLKDMNTIRRGSAENTSKNYRNPHKYQNK